MPHMLDRLSSGMYKEVVDQRGFSSCSSAGSRWRGTTTQTMALPRVQFAKRCPTKELLLLVRERARSKTRYRTATFLLWTDMFSTKDLAKEMSSSLWHDMSRRSLPALLPYGPYSTLLLRQQVGHTALCRHRLRAWLELR